MITTTNLLKKTVLCGLFAVVCAMSLSAQEQLGMRLERFAGQYGNSINPANTAFNPNRWEIHLVSADFYAENNYAYLQNTSLFNAYKRIENIAFAGDTARGPLPSTALIQNFSEPKRDIFCIGQFRIAGPGITFRINDQWTVGLQSAVRGLGSGYAIPGVLNFFNLDRTPRFQDLPVTPLEATGMAWGEAGIPISKRFGAEGNLVTVLGITPKILKGMEAAYGQSETPFRLQKRGVDTLSFNGSEWEYGLTLSNVWESNTINYDAPRYNGRGAGLDLGLAWAMPDENGTDDQDYLWKAGISLMDIGVVQFNNNAVVHRLSTDTTVLLSTDKLTNVNSITGVSDVFSNAFYDDPKASLTANAFTVGLPTALSFQADYKIRNYLYISGLWVQRMPLYRVSLKRANTLAVVPRFEHRWASVSLPVVVNDWHSVRIGLAARLAFLTIGSDNLASLIHKNKFTGTDFYMGFKINGFSLMGLAKGKAKGGKYGKQNRRKIKCYSF